MKKHNIILLSVLFIILFSVSCHKDLDQVPIDPDSLSEFEVFQNPTEAKMALAKLYVGYALTGQQGPAGAPDIDPSIIDEGFSQYTRMLFNLNELTTDHAVVGWGDAGLQDLHGLYWAAGNDFTDAMYYRLAQEVTFCNSFISNATPLNSDAQVQLFIAEARFLRAYAYYSLMDLFGNVPLVTEISTVLPAQSNRTDIFNFVESELLEIKDILAQSGVNEYGRVDRVAAWALLSRLYLNAKTWIDVEKYTESITYSKLVIESSYNLNLNDANGNGSGYDELFLADNDSNGAQDENIFVINFDGLFSKTYGGSTFLVHAATGGAMNPAKLGINGGWGGLRSTSSLVNKFEEDLDIPNQLNTQIGPVSLWGLVGNATENGWDGPDQVLYEKSSGIFARYIEMAEGEYKIRYNNDWAVNFGDNPDNNSENLTIDSNDPSNMKISAPGFYYFEVNFNNSTYKIEAFNDLYKDKRAMFFRNGQSLEISDIAQFKEGYAVSKFKNIKSNGEAGSDGTGSFVDTDIPLIRFAEINLNYAEAVLRGGSGGSTTEAVNLVNDLRNRAYGDNSGNITTGDLTLDFILDERSRELYWEGQRRTDLIRYGYFTSDTYLWPWKGNSINGVSVGSFRNMYPLPPNAISVNSNLEQNLGY